MLLQYGFVLRILVKAAVVVLVLYVLDLVAGNLFGFTNNWPWLAGVAIALALLQDKIAIERLHTLIYLPIKSDLSAFEWIEKRGFNLHVKKRNRRIYVDKAERFWERNEFVRITLMKSKLKLKMNNRLAKEFEQDFLAHIEEGRQA